MSVEQSQEEEFESMMNAVSSNNHEDLAKIMDAPVEEVPAAPAAEPVTEGKEEVEEGKKNEAVAPVVEEPVVEEPKPDAELEQLRNEVHKLRSDAGRIPFTQRRITELEREVATYRAMKAATGTTSGDAAVELDDETKAMIDELKETDPVMAKAFETLARKTAASANSKVTSAFDEFNRTNQESEDERYFSEQFANLTTQIPQAPQIFASNEWKQWKSTLSPGRRAMAESVHADEVATAIYAFAADMQRNAPPQATPPVVTSPEDEAGKKAIQERNRKVNSAAEVPTGAARPTEEFDEDQAYLEMYNKIAKANHIK